MDGAGRPRRSSATVVALVILGLAGCSVGGGGGSIAACDVLQVETPAAKLRPAGPLPLWADGIAGLADSFDRYNDRKVVVYVEAGRHHRLDDISAEVGARRGVVSVESMGLDETYLEFTAIVEGDERILANVRPDDLPTSVTAHLDSADDAVALVRWAGRHRDVVQTRYVDDDLQLDLARVMVGEADRARWREVVDALRDVEEDPGWAAAGADVVEELLDEGHIDPAEWSDRLAAASQGMTEARRACIADGHDDGGA